MRSVMRKSKDSAADAREKDARSAARRSPAPAKVPRRAVFMRGGDARDIMPIIQRRLR